MNSQAGHVCVFESEDHVASGIREIQILSHKLSSRSSHVTTRMHQSLEISGCWQANCVRDVSATALSCHFEQQTWLIRVPPWPLHADVMLLPVKVLDEVKQHQSEA